VSNFGFWFRLITWNLAAMVIAVVIPTWLGFPMVLAFIAAMILSISISLLGSRVTHWEIKRKAKPDA
jgi:hypothetical protein